MIATILYSFQFLALAQAKEEFVRLPTTLMLHRDYRDYFTRDHDKMTSKLVRSVNKAHLYDAIRGLGSGDLRLIFNELQYVLRHVPNHPQGLSLMGSAARLVKRPNLAVPYFEQALRLFPQYALTHAQYGKYLVDSGRTDEGIERLEKAIGMDPELTVGFVWLGRARKKNGDLQEAWEAACQARALGAPREGWAGICPKADTGKGLTNSQQ